MGKVEKLINCPGKARFRVQEKIRQTVLTVSGVSLFVKFEQIRQLVKHRLDTIMIGIVPWCIERKVSKVSCEKHGDVWPQQNTKVDLGMAMVDISAVAKGLKIFCNGWYTLEGDAGLILRGSSVFNKMETWMDNGFFMPSLNKAVDKVLPLVEDVDKILSTQLTIANNKSA